MIPNINGTVEYKDGKYCFPEEYILYSEFSEWVVQVFDERNHLKHYITTGTPNIDLILNRDLFLEKEEYRIEVDETKIRITAAEENGIVWALISLTQMMNKDFKITCGTYSDKPRYEHRGVALDCVRHFFGVDEIKKICEEMSRVKLNCLHWVLSNDQGFRIESKVFPKLQEKMGKSYYTQNEIKEVVEYARIRGIEIIPEIDLPGHTTAILSAYPELSCSGKNVEIPTSGGVYPIVLCPGKEETYLFMEKLLEEIAEVFPGARFHIGGDESPDWEWEKCPHCQHKMKEAGLKETRQLQGYFSERIKGILAKQKKNVICWNDSLMASNLKWQPMEKEGFVQKTEVQYWSVQYAEKSEQHIEQGGTFIYSDMFELYLDYPSCMTSMKKIYECVPEIRGKRYSKSNSNIKGIEACLWTEYILDEESLEQRLFPRVFALAENAWCNHLDYKNFQERVSLYIIDAKRRNVACLSMDEADPKGERKKEGIKKYTEIMKNGMTPEMHELSVKFTQPNAEFQERFMKKFFGV